jgi:hypothetical protein
MTPESKYMMLRLNTKPPICGPLNFMVSPITRQEEQRNFLHINKN